MENTMKKTLTPLLIIQLLVFIVLVPFLPIIISRDLGWTEAWVYGALAVILGGYITGTWVLLENRFFSGVVVVDTGPYRFVRHPGYAGAILVYFATPILLDSLWTFLTVVVLVAILVLRTSLEDRTLQAELPGYSEYAERTRYRLLPAIW